jgi:hypothetical protein
MDWMLMEEVGLVFLGSSRSILDFPLVLVARRWNSFVTIADSCETVARRVCWYRPTFGSDACSQG